jgi:hypothetical protein
MFGELILLKNLILLKKLNLGKVNYNFLVLEINYLILD